MLCSSVVCRLSVTYVLCLNGTEKLSEEANIYIYTLDIYMSNRYPAVEIRTPATPHPQTGVMTALLKTSIANQLAAWLLLTTYRNLPTPYPTVPSPTLYGHLLSQSRSPDATLQNIAYCQAVRWAILSTPGFMF